jgi:hypothetical protein
MKHLIASTVLAICFSASCYGALIVDQSNVAVIAPPPGGNRSLVPNINNTSVQVVTAGVTGKLFRIELGVFRFMEGFEDPLLVDIASTAGQLPDFSPSARLATRTILRDDVAINPDPHSASFSLSVDFSADNLYFEQGEQFAIMLRSDQPGLCYGWWINSPVESTYAGGAAYSLYIPPHPTNGLSEHGDSQFRTYVNVPEPSAFGLAAASLFALFFGRKAAGMGERL